jgi:pimeloyl-ACP methyl ester carboxylesterase
VRNPPCCITPADLGFDYEEVAFSSSDGVMLSGWYIPSRNKATVILLHGYGGNRLEMIWRADMLARHGYGVLLYDQRASGESGGDVRSYGWFDVNDVEAALGFLQSRDDIDPERIGILGFSVGGQVALRTAARTNRIKAVAADGPSMAIAQDAFAPASLWEWLNISAIRIGDRLLARRTGVPVPPGVAEVIADIAPRPILLISTGESYEQRQARRYYDLANEPKMLWEIPEAGHGGGPSTRPQEYEEGIVTFFDQALLADVDSD